MRILLVEDEAKVASFLERGLREAGYDVVLADDGSSGYEQARNGEFDFLILDWMLPGMSGIELCRRIREQDSDVPVMLLTARDTVDDKITGLDCGADDYITKPFAFEELLARIRSLYRRTRQGDDTILNVAGLCIDLFEHSVSSNGRDVPLSNREFELLVYFARRPNKLVTREMLARDVWKITFDTGTNYIDVYVNYLRNKLKGATSKPLIFTLRGAGYILKAENEANH